MITAIIIAILSIFAGMWISYAMLEDNFDLLTVGLGLFISSILWLASIGVLFLFAPKFATYTVESKIIYIKNINDDTKTDGTFFLGSGTIKEKPVYYFYKILPNGNKSRDYIYSNNSEISETGSKYNPYILKMWHSWKSNNTLWFPDFPNDCGTKLEGKYLIVVPPNSISSDIILDNKN